MKKIVFILSIILMSQFNSVIAQPPAAVKTYTSGWHKIGEINVDFKKDRDAIVVWGTDRFKAIMLKVTDARIHMEDCDVYYQIANVKDEIKEDIALRADFKPGEKSRVVNLKYPCLNLQKIVFVYRTVPNWKYEKAHVDLYGLK